MDRNSPTSSCRTEQETAATVAWQPRRASAPHPDPVAATVAENQRKEREWEAAHPLEPRRVHQTADDETRRWNQQREAEWQTAPGRLEAVLRELCPGVFRDPPVPLAIGIDAPLRALLVGEFDEQVISRFLRDWVCRPAYHEALARGGPRFDLDGHPTGTVTVAERVRRGGAA